MLKKFLNPGHSPLTVAMVETAWQEFILNRSQSALAGVPPHDYKTVSQKVTEVSVSSLASSHQSLQAEVAELQNKLRTTGRDRKPARSGGGGQARRSGTGKPPAKRQKPSPAGGGSTGGGGAPKKVQFCWNFNSVKGCAAANPGGHCARDGKMLSHTCSKKLGMFGIIFASHVLNVSILANGSFCTGKHSRTVCTK